MSTRWARSMAFVLMVPSHSFQWDGRSKAPRGTARYPPPRTRGSWSAAPASKAISSYFSARASGKSMTVILLRPVRPEGFTTKIERELGLAHAGGVGFVGVHDDARKRHETV